MQVMLEGKAKAYFNAKGRPISILHGFLDSPLYIY